MEPKRTPTERTGRKVLYDNPRLRLLEDSIVTHTGRERIHWKVDYKREGVGIVPVAEGGRVILGLHWRYCTECWGWEIPAGSVDPGEDIAAAARRELIEETSHDAEVIEYRFRYHPAPGLGNETFHVFAATGLVEKPGSLDDEEIYEVKAFDRDGIERLRADGLLTDGFSLTALYHAMAHGLI